ncbi:MAG: serine hydrolase domain-containing protein, partial [Bryobacteraceae bacterium]
MLTEAITDRAFPGAAYGVLLRGQVLAMESAGRFTYEADAPPVLPRTIFDMASVSKVLATTAMAMLVWERGQLDLDEPIAERIPEFLRDDAADGRRRTISARMLLAHSSGLPAYARLFERCRTAPALLDACLQMPLEAPPDTHTVYSDIGFIVLGHLLETLAGEPLDRYCQRRIFDPLAMESTMYCPATELRPSIPPTGMDDLLRHRMLQGEVHDDNCFVLGGVSGHAGVFSNVADTLRFAGCALHGGEQIYRAETVSRFTARWADVAGA